MKQRIFYITVAILSCFCLTTFAVSANDNQPPINYEIKGLEDPALANAVKRVKLVSQSFQAPVDRSAVTRFVELSRTAMKKALAPYGYLHPQIDPHVTKGQGQWHVSFDVQPGPKLVIRSVSVRLKGEGRHHKAIKPAVKGIKALSHTVFNAEAYENAKTQLMNAALAHGFLEATMEQSQVLINKKANTADVNIVFNTKAQYRFGRTQFSPSPLSDAFLKRYLTYQTGDAYESAKIQQVQTDLNRSGYFLQAKVLPQKNQIQHKRVPVNVITQVQPKHLYQFGLGAGTDSGPRVSSTLLVRRLTKTGHQVALTGQLSLKRRHAEVNYMIPGADPARERYTITGAVFSEDYANGDTNRRILGLRSIKQLGTIRQTLGVNLQNEHSQPTNQPSFTSTMILPSANWLYIKRDDQANTAQGYKLSFALRGSAQALLSDVDFVQGRLFGKWLYPLPLHNRLDLEGTLGLMTVSNIQKLPLSLQFWTGGAKNLRGFDFRSVGTGRKLVEVNIQLQHAIYDNWYLGPFFDLGNAANSPFKNLQKSTGAALSWSSPVGAIELSLAHALTDLGKNFKVQFSMEPEL